MKKLHNSPVKWLKIITLAGGLFAVGACDFSIVEPPKMPRWEVSITVPLINKVYDFAGVVDDSTIFADTTTNELRIEFSGLLDTTLIDESYLIVELPAEAIPPPISESISAPDASDFFSPVTESITVTIKLDSLLASFGPAEFDTLDFPYGIPFVIPTALWNQILVPPFSPISRTEAPVALYDTNDVTASNNFIERVRYIQLSSVANANEFTTTIVNKEMPTTIDNIEFSISSGQMAVTHTTATLDSTRLGLANVYTETTDLASEKLGSSIDITFGLEFPTTVADIVIPANTDPQFEITFLITVAGVDSIGITTAQTSLLTAPLEKLPLPGGTELLNGVFKSGLSPDTANAIKITGLLNTLPFDIAFGLTFPNFDSPAGGSDSLSFGPYALTNGMTAINDTAALAGYTFLNPAGSAPVDSFEYDVLAEVQAADIVLPLDGSFLGSFNATIEVENMHFSSIQGTFALGFDAVNTTINDIPTGFVGFQFDHLSLVLMLYNTIDLPVQLDLALIGYSLEGDSVVVPITADLNYPSRDISANGDTAITLILLDQNGVTTYYLGAGGVDTTDAWDSVITPANGGGSIVDVLNLPPDRIQISGAADVDGTGTVETGKGLWGSFELQAPFAFLIPVDIEFLPVAPIAISPMAESTRETIITALLSATLTTETVSTLPIGGSFSMLIGSDTLFTPALDYLDDLVAGIATQARPGDTTLYTSLTQVLAADSITGISHIVFYPDSQTVNVATSPTETRAKRVEFFANASDTEPLFWIGRLFDLKLPEPNAVDVNGHVTESGASSQVITMDAERISWIAADTTLYMKTFITFNGATGVRTFQTTNYIEFLAYMTFHLDGNVFGLSEITDSTGITVTPLSVQAVAVDSTLALNLANIFSHGTLDIIDFEFTHESSHTGIAATTRLYTLGGTKYLEIKGISVGSAKITVTADDDPDDRIAPTETTFYVSVTTLPSPNLRGHPIVDRLAPDPGGNR